MQREVQRLLRDCMRIQGELIAEHFTQEQLAATTNLQYPTMAEKQQAQQIAQQAAMMGQPPPPEVQSALVGPSWEDIMQLLRTDGMRSARIDIETDSTIADMVDRDMKPGDALLLGELTNDYTNNPNNHAGAGFVRGWGKTPTLNGRKFVRTCYL